MEVLEFLKNTKKNGFGGGAGSGGNSFVSGYGAGYGHGSGSGYSNDIGDGDGSGFSTGDGDGSGDGFGSGFSTGDGSGSGSGYSNDIGDGFGSSFSTGDGSGVKSINKMSVYDIDDIDTAITKIKNNIAKGFVVNSDLTLTPCFIVKRNNLFAHGKTLREAVQSLESKLFDDMTIEERIEMFLEEFDIDKKYQAKLFFDWHNKLTGSCEMGRMSFIKNNGIDLENDYYTVAEFIELVENDYGSEVIKELKNKIEEEIKC